MKIQINVGPGWDTFAFLANALEFAGKSIGYAESERPPFLSFLTSLFFRLGYVSETTIFFVDGALFVVGAIGLYLFFKLRFDSIQSFFGSLLFVSFPIVLQWVATGYTDIASVSLSIWALYLTVLAVKKDSRFFYISFPIAMMAFLTRYPAGLIIFPMALYILISGKYLKNFKDMIIGIFAAIAVAAPFLTFFYKKFGDPFFPFVGAFSATAGPAPTEHFAYVPNPFYYLSNLPSYISAKGFLDSWMVYIIAFIVIIGIVIYIFDIATTKMMKSKIKKHVYEALRIERRGTKIKLIIFVVLLAIFVGTFGRISYMASEAVFFVFCYAIYSLLKDLEIKKIDIDLLFLSWFMSYFIFHSLFAVKVDRYFVTMAPAFSYFVVLGVSEISDKLRLKIRNVNLTPWILSIVLVFLVLSSVNVYMHSMSQKKDYIVEDDALASNWLVKYDPNYKDKIIYSDIWPISSWDLEMDVKPMPSFKDPRAFNHELEKYNVDYYFGIRSGMNLTSYNKITQFGTVVVYKKNQTKFEMKPYMLYIGKNWQNYIEDILDFKTFVIYEGGKYGLGEATYIDGHDLNELKKYPCILLYNFRWHDQKKAENLILDYAKSGGTVVIDASSNLNGIFNNLDDTIFLDTMITRKSLPPYPKVWISPKLGKQNIKFSPFLSEGQTWYGANYEPFGENKIENLVTADGNTLIGVQKVGKGKIIWIGYNFVWHAFILENMQERKLIQGVLEL